MRSSFSFSLSQLLQLPSTVITTTVMPRYRRATRRRAGSPPRSDCGRRRRRDDHLRKQELCRAFPVPPGPLPDQVPSKKCHHAPSIVQVLPAHPFNCFNHETPSTSTYFDLLSNLQPAKTKINSLCPSLFFTSRIHPFSLRRRDLRQLYYVLHHLASFHS